MKLLHSAKTQSLKTSRPVWGAWIEMLVGYRRGVYHESRPVWGAWIEIALDGYDNGRMDVAPRMGRVD